MSEDSPRYRFPKSLRVRLRRDFDLVRREGRNVRDGVLRIRWRENGLETTRLGLAVSRRAGNAVHRNRIKRLVREAFRLQQHGLPPGLDLVVSPADPRRASRWPDVSASLARLLRDIARKRK